MSATHQWPTLKTWCVDMPSVLVVEDESAIAELIAINLRHAGFEVKLAADAD